MAERSHREGWQVPQRAPAIAAVAVIALVAVLLVTAGWAYRRWLAPGTHHPVSRFPAPGVESYIHDGVEDAVPRRAVSGRDPAVEAAKRAVVAEGLPGWGAGR